MNRFKDDRKPLAEDSVSNQTNLGNPLTNLQSQTWWLLNRKCGSEVSRYTVCSAIRSLVGGFIGCVFNYEPIQRLNKSQKVGVGISLLLLASCGSTSTSLTTKTQASLKSGATSQRSGSTQSSDPSNVHSSVPSNKVSSPSGVNSLAELGAVYQNVDDLFFRSPSSGYGLFSYLSPVNDSCAVAVAKTDDGGKNFLAPAPVAFANCSSGTLPKSIYFDQRGEGFVYGTDGLFLSGDGGATWKAVPTISNVFEVTSIDGVDYVLWERCFQKVCNLELQSSNNEGMRWSYNLVAGYGDSIIGNASIRAEANGDLVVAFAKSEPTQQQLSQASTILFSSSHGVSWRSNIGVCGVDSYAYLSQAIDGTIWLGCGDHYGAGSEPKLFATSIDGGSSWMQSSCPKQRFGGYLLCANEVLGYIGGIVAISSNSAMIYGDSNNLWITNDRAANWSNPLPQFNNAISGISKVTFVNPQHGWLVVAAGSGTAGGIWVTADGGATWSEIWSDITTASAVQ